MAGTVRQPIDVASLEVYIKQLVPDINVPFDIKQFGLGQSNPTYQLTDSGGQKYVLRKKPPGQLVSKTAHKVEREYRVIHALEHTDVPVPRALCLCEDSSIIGTPFYIMNFLKGRIIEDPSFPGVAADERTIMWKEAVRTLAKLHRVNPTSVGLSGFGKHSEFYDRQIVTFRMISESQGRVEDAETKEPVGDIPDIKDMLGFFGDHKIQPKDRSTIIHGDYKIDNLVFHETEPRVIGILECVPPRVNRRGILTDRAPVTDYLSSWELSTIGHPLSDLVNLVTPWTMTDNTYGITTHQTFDTSTVIHGLPTMDQCIKWYCEVAEWDPAPDMPWGVAFWLFRTTVVMQGIAARYASRQASGTTAREFGLQMIPHAQMALDRIEELKQKHEHLDVVKARL